MPDVHRLGNVGRRVVDDKRLGFGDFRNAQPFIGQRDGQTLL